jgi:excisionase family DNA binding protein
MHDDALLTVGEAARRLRVSEETIRRMLRSGRLHGVRLGGTRLGWRVRVAEVEALLGPKAEPAQAPTLSERERREALAAAQETVGKLYDQFGYALWLGLALHSTGLTVAELARRAGVPVAFVEQLQTVGPPDATVRADARIRAVNAVLAAEMAAGEESASPEAWAAA